MAPHEDFEETDMTDDDDDGDAEPEAIGGTIFLGDPTTVADPTDPEHHFGTGHVKGIDSDGDVVQSPEFCVHADDEVRETLQRLVETGGTNDGARTSVGYTPSYAKNWDDIFPRKPGQEEQN